MIAEQPIESDRARQGRIARWADSIQLHEHEDKVLLVLTLIIGAVVGLVVVAFILLTESLGSRLYPGTGSAWRRLLIPIGGSLITGFFLARYFPDARGSGIPQTKTALFLRDGYISLRTVLGKFSMCSITLASGIALGREGPSVQVSAGIASVLGRRLGLSPRSVKALVPIGAAAALAAAFNTPIAAVLFTLEEVMGDMHAPVLGSIVLSSATSWMVLHLLLGDEPLFHVPAYQLVHPLELFVYAILGIAGGLVSAAFVKSILFQRKFFLSLPKKTAWLQPVAGGLMVGLLGWFVPEVLGVGYGFVDQALNGKMIVATMAMLVCLKVVATSTCYASGNAGGIFGPSLFMGAMMGGAVGGVAHLLLPDYTGSIGAYALVGMGAAFAGTIRVPPTSVIMIFEITRDYSIIVPLMIANLTSYFISSRLQKEPIYEALQHQDGISLPSGAKSREALLVVAQGYHTDAPVFKSSTRIADAIASADRDRAAWPVVDDTGLRGMVTIQQLDEAVAHNRGDEDLGRLVPAPGIIQRLTAENFPHVHTDHLLDVAMRRFAETGLNVLPVVSRTNVRELRGSISLQDVLNAYGIGGLRQQPVVENLSHVKAPVKLLIGVVVSFAAIALISTFLSYYYRTERANRAQQFYEAGNDLLQKERYDEAIGQYREALSVSHNLTNRLALGIALVKGGHLAEAPIYLNEVLREQPNSSEANLAMAEILTQQGQIDRAVVRYQRAIDGSWRQNASQNRFQTRIEMIKALEKAGRRSQAEAELLATAAAIRQDPALQTQVGQMMLDYGMAKVSVGLFREAVRQNPRDAAAYDGLGDALFDEGSYRQALDAYRQALQTNPLDPEALQKSELSEQILALNPTVRGVGEAERFRRSQALLSGVADELQRCAAADSDVQAARAVLAATKRPLSYGDAAESNTALAEHLWAARPPSCAVRAGDPLPHVMASLSRLQ